MPLQKKTVQLRLSTALYARARSMAQEVEWSFNDFAVDAIKEKMQRAEEQKIDAAFARMGKDQKYLNVTAAVSRDFEQNDIETLGTKAREGK